MNEHELQLKYQQSTGENPLTLEFLRWREQYYEKNHVIWIERYVFLEEWNVFLVAQYDRETNHQKLVVEEYCNITQSFVAVDSIRCIHTAITQKPVEFIEQEAGDPEFQKDILNLRSIENLVQVELSPKEKFFALKSWVQGIAQAGFEALVIQREIEAYANLLYPISQFLFRAMLRIDKSLSVDFIRWIKKQCVYNGAPHLPSLTANLLFIGDALFNQKIGTQTSWKDYDPIVNAFLEIVEYALDFEEGSQKYMMGPVNLILKFIQKFRVERNLLEYINRVCDMFHIEDITKHPVLKEMINPLLDSLSCRYWVIQELLNHVDRMLKDETRYGKDFPVKNELGVKKSIDNLASMGIHQQGILTYLASLREKGLIVNLATIDKKKIGLLAVPFDLYTDLKKRQYEIIDKLRYPFRTLPPPTLFFKYNKYRFIFEQNSKVFIESGWYWFYEIWIRGMKQYAIENKHTGDVYLNISRSKISTLDEVEGLSIFGPKVSYLDVSHNKIDDLSQFVQFSLLTYLDLRNNSLNPTHLNDLHDLVNMNSLLVTLKVDPEIIMEVARFLPRDLEEKMIKFCKEHWEEVFGSKLEIQQEEEDYNSNREEILTLYIKLYNEQAEMEPPVHLVSLINLFHVKKRKYSEFWQMIHVLG